MPSVLVDAWLPRAAERHPDRPAVNALTYAELLGEVDATARRLAGRGVRAGDRVGIALAPGEAFCIALHAVLRLGAVAVPVDLRLSARERERVVQGTVEVIDGAVIGDAGLRGAPARAPRPRRPRHRGAHVGHERDAQGGRARPTATGCGARWARPSRWACDPAERWLCALPLSHVGGLSIVMRSAIYATTAIVHERFDTDRVLDALVQEDGPTIVSLVPTTLQRLLDAGLREPPALRWALLGGAPATTALQGRAAAAGVPVATTYGLTEACSQVTTLGAPLFCTRVRMAGDGEILVSGPTVAGWAGSDRPVLATGDLGEWRPDGALAVAGRKADTIVSGGENVAPAEVEAVLEAHPDVVEAAVHGRADPEWGEAVVATVVADPDVEAEELRAWCAERLARFKVPKEIAFTVALPRTPSGKVARKDLQMSDERDELIARWDTMAAGWKATRANFQGAMEPVSQWLVEAIHPQPGHSVLELAAGLGDTGLLAAQLVAPGGSVLITDGSDNMVAAAREHAEEVGATNVELRSMQAEWIDLPTASVDGVICRFGYMLLLDPEAALRETRRVLKPGGRVALAVWDDLERNPWMKVLREALVARGLAPAAVPDGPGPFSLGSEEAVAELLATAGFEDIEVSPMDLVHGRREPRCLVGSGDADVDHHGRGRPRPGARGALPIA